MTTSQRRALVLLAAVAVLVVAALFYGQTHGLGCQLPAKECAHIYKPGAGMTRLKGLFGSTGTQLRIPQQRLAPNASVSVPVNGAKNADVATLSLQLKLGQKAKLSYVDNAPAANPVKDPQSASLPDDAAGDPDGLHVSFAVSRGGGTVTIACMGVEQCLVVTR